MTHDEIIRWLLEGDVAVQYQVYRDLRGEDRKDLQTRIKQEGWGGRFLSLRNVGGHWGRSYYQPKWTSTHYTLLDLRNLCISHACRPIRETVGMVLEKEKGGDGGINPSPTIRVSDVCLNGMALDFSCYFQADEAALKSMVDFLLSQQMPDGGFNCYSNRQGARHSSLHTTLSVLEGFCTYRQNGYQYRLKELSQAERGSVEFLLKHRLYQSHRTGETIHPKMLSLSYPCRWRYDILRALDYFQSAAVPYDERMADAVGILLKKRNSEKLWKLGAHHPGVVHFDMERTGQPSRWNTLRAMRVLKHFRMI